MILNSGLVEVLREFCGELGVSLVNPAVGDPGCVMDTGIGVVVLPGSGKASLFLVGLLLIILLLSDGLWV